jgi:ribosomal protein S18 acetylase RimI-like enzyme
MLSIKNASVADIPLIRELTMQVWPQTYTPILGNEQVDYMLGLFYTPASLEKQMGGSGHQFIICYSDGLPVAFASWAEVEEHIFKLHKIYVIPGQQGKSVGRTILDHIVREIKLKGGKTLLLNVNKYNFSAKAFYEKTGFKHVKDEDIDIGGGYFMNDHVLMMKLG